MRNILFILLLLLFSSTSLYAQPSNYSARQLFSEGLATVQVNGKWGYIDHQGNLVIPAIYNYASGFNNGYANVSLENARFSINNKGERINVTEEISSSLQTPIFYEPVTEFITSFKGSNKMWGLKNLNDEIILEPSVYSIESFTEGLAVYSTLDDENITSDTLPDAFALAFQAPDDEVDSENSGFKLTVIEENNEDYRALVEYVTSNRKYGYLNTQGQVVIPATYSYAYPFSDGLAIIVNDKKYSFIDHNGNNVFDQEFYRASQFSEGLAAVNTVDKTGNLAKWGYLDKNGDFAIPAIYSEARSFFQGLAKVETDNHWGLINKHGEFVVEPIYSHIAWPPQQPYRSSLIYVELEYDGRKGLIDLQGNLIVQGDYSFVDPASLSEGLLQYRMFDDGHSKMGFINLNGEIVIPAIYDHVEMFNEGFASVWVEDRFGYIDREGNFLWEPSK